jgi:hypothetical protein
VNRQAFLGCLNSVVMHRVSDGFKGLLILGGAVVLACAVSSVIQVADYWSKAVVSRLSKFCSLQGPGLASPPIFCLVESLTSRALRGIQS